MVIVNISESISTKSGGVGQTIIQLSNTLESLCKNSVYIICGNDDGEIADKLTDNVVLITLNKLSFGRFSILLGLFDVLDKIKPDRIIQHGIWGVFSAQITLYSKLRKVPYVVCPHGMLDPYILARSSTIKYLASVLYQKINIRESMFLRALNGNEMEHCKNYIDVPVFVVPNGIDLFCSDAFENKKTESTVLFLGRIDEKKGVFELISAWLTIKKEGTVPCDAKLKIVGWASNQKYYEKCVLLSKDEDSIQFLGALYGLDKLQVYNSSGAYILPSKGEGLPTTVLEAWRAKSIVLMSEMCNFESRVFSEELAINSGDNIKSIADAIVVYFNLSEARKIKIRNSAFEFLKNNYSWEKIGIEFNNLLEHKTISDRISL